MEALIYWSPGNRNLPALFDGDLEVHFSPYVSIQAVAELGDRSRLSSARASEDLVRAERRDGGGIPSTLWPAPGIVTGMRIRRRQIDRGRPIWDCRDLPGRLLGLDLYVDTESALDTSEWP